jgi:hypothetical protein
LVLVAVLAGCSTGESGSVTCNAANWDEFVGQPETAVYGLLANMRIVRDGEPITKDLNRDRLNAEVGKDGNITRFACY